MQKQVRGNFEIGVQVSFLVEESRPDENYYLFSYKIRISNRGSIPAQLLSRHWIITDSCGKREEVRGAGVIGLQPRILPGQSFEYESFCPLPTPSGSMTGTYQMISETGEHFEVEIPEFFLVSPSAIH